MRAGRVSPLVYDAKQMQRSGLYIVLLIVGCVYLAIAINAVKIHWDQEQLMEQYQKHATPKVTAQ